jgi:proteasome lid subunit RPN8/RPN11
VRLRIQAKDLEGIAAAAAAAFPEECCGLLVGAGDRAMEGEGEEHALVVVRIVAAANISDQPRNRFEVDPTALFEAHRGARAAGQLVIGHYHSHPGGSAAPSAYDRARAAGEGEVWLIVAVDGTGTAGAAAARAHFFKDGRFREIEIVPEP